MNKKGKFYSNNKSTAFTKIKDYNKKSNQKKTLSRSMEKRRKANPILEQNSDQFQRIKIVQNRPNKENIIKKNNNNLHFKSSKRKDYTNSIGINKKKEEKTLSIEKEKKYNYLRLNNNKEGIQSDYNKINIPKYNRNIQINEEKKQKQKNQNIKNPGIKKDEEEYSVEEEEEEVKEEENLLYRTLYRTSKKNIDTLKEKKETIKNTKEIKNGINNINTYDKKSQKLKNVYNIVKEQTDNLYYNKDDKSIEINSYNNKNQIPKPSVKKSKQKNTSIENKIESKISDNSKNLYSPKKDNKKSIIDTFEGYNTERAIDLFIIDDNFDINFITKSKKKINRKNNKFREIIIENFEPNMPMKKEKFTGFIFIRKSNGKKMYKLELPDDLEKINDIFKNESIMIKNQIIQILPLNKMMSLNKQNQTEIKKPQNEKNLEKELEKEKEIIKDKERQITLLKNKNEELNNNIKKQIKQITQLEKELKNIKLSNDQLKDSFQALDKENKTLKSQLQTYKIRRKSIQMQEEESSQRSLMEIKDRIQKYKNELRKPSSAEEKDKENHKENHKKPISDVQNNNLALVKNQIKNNNKNFVPVNDNKKQEELENDKEKNVNNEKEKDQNIEEEYNYEDDYNYEIYDEKDPKAKKMKKAMVRFRKKYKDIIIENKKNLKLKEKEEQEKEEAEKRDLYLDIDKEEGNYFIEEKEERERKDREEKERKEKEKKQREEQERKEKEREKRENEEKERKEKEKNKYGQFGVGQNKIQNNFSKMLADKMKFSDEYRKTIGIDNNLKPKIIIEKKVDVVNLIEGQPFKRKTKKKPTRKMFMD